jgi:choline-sulfatase
MPKDILVLMTDQHRLNWAGAFGGSHVRTPTLDSLASEGAVFTRCFTPSPVCMPARSSFLTGLYPHSHGQWHNVGRVQDVNSTCLHSLRAAGYRTCHVGKSHLHPHGSGRDLRSEEPFMHALGWDDVLECTGPYATQNTRSILTDWMEECGTYRTFLDDYRKRREVGVNHALWPSPLPDGKHMDDFMARTAVDYIRSSDTSQPLYLFVGIGGPHDPWDPPKQFDTYTPESMPPPLPHDPVPDWLEGAALEDHETMMSCGHDITAEQWLRVRSLYSGRVEHVDGCMGRVLEAWMERRGGDSWVMFWTDHGEMLGDKGRTCKSVFYDACVRVPAVIRPPGGAPEPISHNGMISLTDLTATLFDMAECAEVPPNVFGESQLPVFENGDSVGRSVVFSEIQDRTMVFDGRWKMVMNTANEILQLFDTVEDPNESINLAGRPDMNGIADRLRRELLDFLLSTMYRQTREINR